MPRRRRSPLHLRGHEHLDRWLVSYADYMTLIFALFVVLYSVAMVNKEKYKEVLEGVTQAFTMTVPQGKGILEAPGDAVVPGVSGEVSPTLLPQTESAAPESMIKSKQDGAALADIDAQLGQAMGALVDAGLVKLNRDDEWLTIELNSGLLFASGSASPSLNAGPVINAVSRIIKPVDNYVRVRGYTDNQQINNEIFRSNWQLSAARAGVILEAMVSDGIDPHRLAMEAYGEFSPWSDNESESGRAQNRKVVIALSRYAWKPPSPTARQPVQVEAPPKVEPAPVDSNNVKIIELPGGGIRITTRQE
ncbi:flagellar motor protein MotB [Aeromonas schubertii]|uniref:flagellar motor protein MotB n=1 Tax=Aeromonas schubertii TaxID=652 RepID=UPI0010A7CBB9|nr:flagellar motor protein MotB [Aeromonas schubertii]QCG47682.1 cell envelope biogenesis protein OmpA [Aeromonas schubertii]